MSIDFADIAILTVQKQESLPIVLEYHSRRIFAWGRQTGSFGLHVSCLRKGRPNRKLAIWIQGGPWAHVSSSLVLEQLAFLNSGYDLFAPYYPGTADRTVEIHGVQMNPDIVDAFAELQAALQWGRKRYDRVDVVGTSFGAFLAASVAPELGGKNSLFLLNPNLGGETYLRQLYATQGEELEIEGVSQEKAQAEAKRITDAYFRRLGNYDALGGLQSAKGLKLKLVHGGRDQLTIPSELAALKRLAVPGCGVDFRPDSGHESGYKIEHYRAFGALIRCDTSPRRR